MRAQRSDAELIAASLVDPRAFAPVFERHFATVHRYLARRGYKVRSLDSDTTEEAPHEFMNWFRQRVRWQKGWMQTCIVHSRAPRDFLRALGARRAAAAAVLVLGSVASGA